MGGDFTIADYLLWNELPVALGNLVGGLVFVGLMIYATHVKTGAKRDLGVTASYDKKAA
jgi:formate/nitrite transporter FocA (FNT family)